MANNLDINKNIGDLSKLNDELKETATLLASIVQNQKTLSTELNKSKGLSDLNKNQNKVKTTQNEIEKQGNKLLGQRNTLIAKQSQALKPLTKEVVKQQEATKEMNKQMRAQAKIDLGIKKRNGLFRSMTKSILAAGVAMIGIRTVFNVFKTGIKTIANFEEAMSKVKAVTGALPKDFKALQASAKNLGSSTSKTASQVAGLQLEFAKLGFSTAEILNATEATISLSIAAGSDLANSAVVAASTIRGFGLDAAETQRVVDVMAKSFSSSALDLEKFKVSMAAVAPVAKANGKDIEFVTARLSVLSDAGLDASTSGTSLRNMFLTLSKKGLTWEQGLEKINTATDKNVTALDLFGKRGATAALILADNIEKAEGLEKAYDGAWGAAKKMSDIMENNLIGDTKKLGSAWEGFVLNLNKGEGKLTAFFRDAVQLVTRLVGKIDDFNKSNEQLANEANAEAINKEYEAFIENLQKTLKAEDDLTKHTEIRNDAIENEIALKQHALEIQKKLRDEVLNNDADPESLFFYDDNIKVLETLISKYNDLKKVEAEAEEDGTKSTKKRIKNIDELTPKISKLNKAWQEIIKTFGAEAAVGLQDEILNNQIAASDESFTLTKDLIAKRLKKLQDEADKEIKIERLKQEVIDSIKQEAWSSVNSLGNQLFDLAQSRRDMELESIQNNYAARIDAAEGDSVLQTKLAEELAEKQKQINIQQAKSEQNQALFNLAITTTEKAFAIKAQAALMNAILPGSGAIALTQLGLLLSTSLISGLLIKSQPLPGFFTGTEDAPKGLAWVAEKGRELIETKAGSFIAETPQIMNLDRGDVVKNNYETEKILSGALMNDVAINGNEGVEQRLDSIGRKLKNLKQVNVNYDINGFEIHMRQGNNKVRYLNSKGRK